MDVDTVSLKRYYGVFLLAYITSYILVIVIMMIFHMEKFPGIQIAMSIVGADFAMRSFLKQQRRAPLKLERRKLVWMSILIVVFLDGVLAVLLIYGGAVPELAEFMEIEASTLKVLTIIMLVYISVFIGVTYLLLGFIYGKGAAKTLKNLIKRGKI